MKYRVAVILVCLFLLALTAQVIAYDDHWAQRIQAAGIGVSDVLKGAGQAVCFVYYYNQNRFNYCE